MAAKMPPEFQTVLAHQNEKGQEGVVSQCKEQDGEGLGSNCKQKYGASIV